MPSVEHIKAWPVRGLDALIAESEQEGFRFLRRLSEQWISGINRFSNPGEVLFGVFDQRELLAVGGISHEAADRGRLRRLYVKRAARRKGIGRLLVQNLLAFAADHYSQVVLFSDTATADRFYRSLGFERMETEVKVSHAFTTRGRNG